MATPLPRGIQIITWKNKDKSKSVKYRVRVKRTDYKDDKLFDTLEQAKEFLNATKSKEGIKGLQEREAEEQAKIYKMVIADFLNRVGLDHIKFHDLRRTMITNFLTAIGAEHSVLASEILGITNVDNMVQKYSTHTIKLETQKDLQATVGHSDDKTTKIYTNIT